jgi:hypothetical protein
MIIGQRTPAGVSEVKSEIVDMDGFDGVAFIAVLGAIEAGGAVMLRILGSDDNDSLELVPGAMCLYEDCGKGLHQRAGLAVEIIGAERRYLSVQLTRTRAPSIVDQILAIQFPAGKSPTFHDDAVLAFTRWEKSQTEDTQTEN